MKQLIIFLILMAGHHGFSQSTTILPGGNSANIELTGGKNGMKIFGLTTEERDAISNPGRGYVVYNLSKNCIEVYNGSYWFNLCDKDADKLPLSTFTIQKNNLTVEFTNTSQRANSYLWNFGNGTTSTLKNPIITYASGGSYTVSLEVTNEAGKNTSSQVVVVTPTSSPNTVTDIDGNLYNTVTIGTQVWMKENLNVTKFKNGDVIPNLTDNTAWGNTTSPAWCRYNNNPSTTNEFKYGLLYNGFAAQDSRGVCPNGWKVPSVSDYNTLIMYLGGVWVAGGKLKQAGVDSYWSQPNTDATNESGFTGLPGGYRYGRRTDWAIGQYFSSSEEGYFITKDSSPSGGVYVLTLHYNNSSMEKSEDLLFKSSGYSIRCIKE